MRDHSHLFQLRYKLSNGWCTIDAWEADGAGSRHYGTTHTRLDIEVRQAGRTIFPRGTLYVGIPGHASIDGVYAKEAVTSCVAMKPGDTDRDYFDNYTEDQLAWAETHGDDLSMQRETRFYGNGDMRP